MYTNDYNKVLERMKTTIELAKDMQNDQRCREVLRDYDRLKAWNCLQDIIHEYRLQIEFCGLPEGIRLHQVLLAQISDDELRMQLWYFGRHIPTYVLVREGSHELGKHICEWLDKKVNT